MDYYLAGQIPNLRLLGLIWAFFAPKKILLHPEKSRFKRGITTKERCTEKLWRI